MNNRLYIVVVYDEHQCAKVVRRLTRINNGASFKVYCTFSYHVVSFVNSNEQMKGCIQKFVWGHSK